MKKNFFYFFIVTVLLLSACTKKQQNNSENEKLTIVTSFYPVYDLTSKIVGDKAEVINLTKTGDAHSFEPNLKDMELISNSDLLVVNGAGFENWLNQIIQSQGDLKILDLSKNIDLINLNELYDNQSVNDEIDPHTWLSPKNVLIMLEDIKNKIIEIDKNNEDYYKQNYEKYKVEFTQLSEDYDNMLSEYKGYAFVAPHTAFNYLVRDYGLKQIGIEGVNSVNEPNAARMKEVVDLMKSNKINTVFYEYGQSSKIAESIANEIGGNVKPISTLEVITEKDINNGSDYITLLRLNLKNLVESFKNIGS